MRRALTYAVTRGPARSLTTRQTTITQVPGRANLTTPGQSPTPPSGATDRRSSCRATPAPAPLAVKITTRATYARSALPCPDSVSPPPAKAPPNHDRHDPAERSGPSGPPVKIDNHDLGSAQTRPHSRTVLPAGFRVGYAVDLALGRSPERPDRQACAERPERSLTRPSWNRVPRPYSGRDGFRVCGGGHEPGGAPPPPRYTRECRAARWAAQRVGVVSGVAPPRSAPGPPRELSVPSWPVTPVHRGRGADRWNGHAPAVDGCSHGVSRGGPSPRGGNDTPARRPCRRAHGAQRARQVIGVESLPGAGSLVVTFPDVNVVRRPGLGPCRNGPASGRASEQHRREQSLSASVGCIEIWLRCSGPVCRPPRSLVHWSGSSWTATPREGRSPPPAAVNSATLGRHHHHETGLRSCQPALPTTADVNGGQSCVAGRQLSPPVVTTLPTG